MLSACSVLGACFVAAKCHKRPRLITSFYGIPSFFSLLFRRFGGLSAGLVTAWSARKFGVNFSAEKQLGRSTACSAMGSSSVIEKKLVNMPFPVLSFCVRVCRANGFD